MTRRGCLLPSVAAAALLCACTNHAARTVPTGAPAASGVTSTPCQLGGDAGPSVPPGLTVVLGAVRLPVGMVLGTDSDDRSGRTSTRTGSAHAKLFAKTGLVVRTGTAVDLAVAPSAAAHAWIGWGNAATPATTQHVDACPGPSTSLGWPGGYWVDAPMCLPLVVRAAGQETTVDIPVGVPCPAGHGG